jgi:acyl carrier protein
MDRGSPVGELLAERLAAAGRRVARAFAAAPGNASDLEALLAGLPEAPVHVVHLWTFPAAPDDPRAALDRGFYSLCLLAQALGRREPSPPVSILVVTGDENPAASLPTQLPGVVCRTLSLSPGEAAETVEQILAEAAQAGAEPWVARRDGRRFARGFEIVPVAAREEVAETAEERHPGTVTPANGSHPRPALANPYVAPQDGLEQQIAAVLQEILGVDPVGLHDNFFELGGNSLAGVRVISRLKERLQVSVSEVSLYEAPTVAAMARLIGAQRQEEPAAAPTFEVSRGRGERRKARQLQKARAGDGV